jgi:signal transduction histidine kinase
MAGHATGESGRTLDATEGLAALRLRVTWQTLRQTTLTVVAIAGFVAGVAAAAAALGGNADDGVVPDPNARAIVAVSPTGFAWRDGIRPGQTVVSFATALVPGGWRLETEEGGAHFVSLADPADSALRDSLPLGLAGLAAGALAVLFRSTHRLWVAPATSVALLLASTPLFLQGNPELSTLAMGGAVFAPSMWLVQALRGGRAIKVAIVVAAAGCLAVWVVARLAGLAQADVLEGFRAPLATTATALVVVDRVVVPILSRDPIPLHRPRLLDAIVVALLSGTSLALVYFLDVSPVVVGVLVVVILVALPGFRRWLDPKMKGALFADIREQAAVEAAEDERARMARELHDVPLQHLAGIIRRLELRPGAQAESDELRVVASQLRTVATNLRPPVLDDLGLPAALDFLAEGSTTAHALVVTNVVDATGLEATSRPPSAVELAVFRIAQEAVGNALQHANAKAVRIEGRIEPDRIDLAFVDDGVGLSPDVVRAAGRRGRLGLASMRRRAEAIEADLTIEGSKDGTTVHIVWQR